MKKVFLAAFLMLMVLIGYDQNDNNGTIKFLGIPVDGTESQFTSKLRKKGFSYDSYLSCYTGQFNGQTVNVSIRSNHNVVDRVYIAFPLMADRYVKAEFNTLLDQFQINKKYVPWDIYTKIPQDEDISYEISVNDKVYEASYSYYAPSTIRQVLQNPTEYNLSELYTDGQIDTLNAYLQLLYSEDSNQKKSKKRNSIAETSTKDIALSDTSQRTTEMSYSLLLTYMKVLEIEADGAVWFTIHEHDGRYLVGLYYDNLHNQAHGEDL